MRDWLKPDRISSGAEYLRELAGMLDEAARLMRDSDIPYLLLHGEDQIEKINTKLRLWAEKLLKDVKTDAPLFAKKEATNAEKEVYRHRGNIPPRPVTETSAAAKPKRAKKG